MIGKLRTAVAAALLLAAGNAWALGLGQIEVKSRRNQPLLAEIPIVSTTPGELQALQARLASPETFRRVGLSPPSGVAADLQFSLGSDARGRPVIRVTTIKPVDQAVLNFLIEVDWGQGRLVREYSAMVEAPNTASAPLQPAIQAPATPAPAVVQRPLPPPTAAVPASVPAPEPIAPPPTPVPAPVASEPAPPPVEVTPIPPPPASQPTPPPTPAPVVAAAAAAAAPPPPPSQYGPVKSGETLSEIASALPARAAYSLDQTMLALLRANPDAFLGDNINRLRQGAVLRVPGRDDVAGIDPDDARQVVRQQMQQWRQARRAVRQPATTVAAAAAPADAAANPKPERAAPATRSAAAEATASAAPRQNEARLEIVPPSAPGRANGTRSGTSAGGEGSMLQQQLRQKDEDIAAKTAEIGELKERVAELEKLKEEQQKLLTLKDTELASAQQRLAEANRSAPAAAAQPAQAASQQASTQSPPPQEQSPQSSMLPWLWGGLGVVALALLAWLLGGRRRKATPEPPRRKVFDSAALAASMVPKEAGAATPEPAPAPGRAAAEAPAQPPPHGVIDLADVPPTPPSLETPAWHSGWVKTDAPGAEPTLAPETPAPRFVPEADGPREVPPQATTEQRFKLARAFLDIGDAHSARELLIEIMNGDDDEASSEAAKMLSRLVGR